MKTPARFAFPLFALTLGSTVFGTRLNAQITEVARTPIADAAQLTYGYLCDDRFVIRNDGTKPVELEYGVEKGTEHTKLVLNARESVELASKSKNAIELWMDGKLVAKAVKERRSCKDVQGNGSVSVTPLEVNENDRSRNGSYAYGSRYPFYDPWSFGMYGMYGAYGMYGGLGFRPFYSAAFGYPIIIGGGGRRPMGRRGR